MINEPPRAITREDVDRFVEDQLECELAATTINQRLATLHEFFEYLAEEHLEEDWPNPVNWKRHKVKPGKPLPRDASEPEIERLFEQIVHPRDRAMFRLMLDAGLRVEEVAVLRNSDLMTSNGGALGRLRVRGKGGKERFVWLTAETLQVVRAWLDERPQVADEKMFVTRRHEGFSVRGIQAGLEVKCSGNPFVTGAALVSLTVVQGKIEWAPSQALAQADINQADLVQARCKWLPVKMGHPATVGLAAHIDQDSDAVTVQQVDRALNGVVAVADGVEGGGLSG